MKFLKSLLPLLLIFSLLLCSCSVDAFNDLIGSITGNTENPDGEDPEHVIPEEGRPDGSEPEEKPEETPGDDNNEDDTPVVLERRSLEGKTIVNFGDSIFGLASNGQYVSTLLAEATGATVYNMGIGGTRMASYLTAASTVNNPIINDMWDPFSMYRLVDAIISKDFSYQEAAFKKYRDFNNSNRLYIKDSIITLKTLDFNNIDIVTISFGTNDFTSSKNNPKATGDNKYNTHALEGALRYSVEKLHEAFPDLEIYVTTPIYRSWFNNDKTAIVGDSTTKKNTFKYVLADYCQMIEDVVSEYDYVTLIDAYVGTGFNADNRSEYFPEKDPTHPNEKGKKVLAEYMAEIMCTQYVVTED